ncbi:polysaccharide biosynthesis protein [Xenorhabdus sp. Reich]|uniref:Polysaccharide biosynthesis protein n=1 Tax=Xenorhabdus littoralis TaxID=2582835 RepID=A0ABU4SJR3_9GAMM|nr:oligosaccharide flippase family protein [Xenorhabdus sp. Reich]MDX7998858.1 polysaccharide biosynthesis protein [Xenorhabdus sp. Reich]
MLRKNIVSNYISQIYVSIVGILILPFYIKYMGAEAYGLVGFFAILQAWFGLLDLGLTPTISRETARYHGGSISALVYSQLFRSLSLIFFLIAFIGGAGLWIFSGKIATIWLKTNYLSIDQVIFSIKIMAISISLRWIGGLYKGIISGSEKFVWLSGFNVIIATLRFVAVFISMWLYGFTPYVFFIHQLFIAIFEIIILFFYAIKIIPSKTQLNSPIGWSFKPVKPILKFALTIAFTSSIWIFVTQTDKLILSGILSLSEYGYFTLAVLVASGILIISGPISATIMPRMARLHAEGKHDEIIQLYRNSTQLVCIIAGSAAATISLCAEPLLFAWTGDPILASHAAPILCLYAIGNGILTLCSFPYYLQYAKGNLRYHFIGNILMAITLIPTIIYFSNHYGSLGAGYVWVTINSLFLLCWVTFIHHKLEPGLHYKWFIKDILRIYIPIILTCIILSFFPIDLKNRYLAFLYTSGIAIITLLIALISSREMKRNENKYR